MLIADEYIGQYLLVQFLSKAMKSHFDYKIYNVIEKGK